MLSKLIDLRSKQNMRLALPAGLILMVCLSSFNASADSYKRSIEADLDLDGKVERIDLNASHEKTLQIRRGKRLLWQGVPAAWKPWKIEIADVDGNGRSEIILGVFKATKFFTTPHNCLFIYEFSGETAFPKWLGSSLSRPFTDFIFADLDNEAGDELIAMETTLRERKGVAVYHWNSFGFTLERRRGEWLSAKIVGLEKGMILIEADGQQILITKDQ